MESLNGFVGHSIEEMVEEARTSEVLQDHSEIGDDALLDSDNNM